MHGHFQTWFEQAVDVFCDGSLTNSVLSDVFTSTVGKDDVGRAMILVPSRDIGVVTQTRDGMLTQRGNPASNEAEVFAIRTASDLCDATGLTNYIVDSDCQGAVQALERIGSSGATSWAPRAPLRQEATLTRGGTSYSGQITDQPVISDSTLPGSARVDP